MWWTMSFVFLGGFVRLFVPLGGTESLFLLDWEGNVV